MGAVAFLHQFGEGRDVAITFDQGWARTDPGYERIIETPNIVGHRGIVTVDEQGALGVECVAGEVDFTHAFGGNGVEPFGRVEADIMGADYDVVDIDEEAAAAAPCTSEQTLPVNKRRTRSISTRSIPIPTMLTRTAAGSTRIRRTAGANPEPRGTLRGRGRATRR